MNLILKSIIKKDIKSVDDTLSKLIKPDSKLSFSVYKQVIESGKRLRPLIVLYSALSLGFEDKNRALVLGAIVEMIHTASLLHDDIIDDAKFRRGRESANTVYGTKPAVLGGDYLYSLAFNMVLDFDIEIARSISKAAYLLAEGEIKEIENAFKTDITADDYYDVIYKKTAVLLQTSSESGSLLSGGEHREQFRHYGENLGFAFQIKDDCLDYESDIGVLGKDTGIDLKEGKITLPVLYAMEVDSSLNGDIKEFFTYKNSELLKIIISKVKKYGLESSIERAKRFSEDAKAAIDFLPSGRYKDYLTAIADYSVERKK